MKILPYLFRVKWWLKAQCVYRFFLGKIHISDYIGGFIYLVDGKKIFLGKNVHIFPQCRMECHDNGEIYIEDDVSIAQNVHITCGQYKFRIGRGTVILSNSVISNIIHDYSELGVPILKQKYIYRENTIGANCMIGSGVCILPGAKIGNHCIVGANSVVKGCFPDYCVLVGSPAKIIKRYNSITRQWVNV